MAPVLDLQVIHLGAPLSRAPRRPKTQGQVTYYLLKSGGEPDPVLGRSWPSGPMDHDQQTDDERYRTSIIMVANHDQRSLTPIVTKLINAIPLYETAPDGAAIVSQQGCVNPRCGFVLETGSSSLRTGKPGV
jgi:hypothetical protein